MSNNNVVFTPTLFLKTTLIQLGDRLKVARNMSSQYSKLFGNESAQVGNSYQLKKPARFIGVDNDLNYNAEALSQQKFQITVDQTASLYFGYDTFEKTLSLEDIQANYAKPAALALASKINAKAARYAALNTFNMVGTPGTVPTAMSVYLGAEDKLIKQGMPEGEALNLIITRAMSSTYLDANKALFNGQSIIGKQMATGQVENTLGYNWMLDETLYTHTTGTQGGTILVNGANQTQPDGNNGIGTLNIDGVTPSITFAKAGDVFTIGNFSVHPQTRVSSQDLQQYTLLTDAVSGAGGLAVLSFVPAITPATLTATTGLQYANVDVAAADNAPVVFWSGAGSASKQSKQALLLHKDAFAFLSVPMANPSGGGVEMVAQEVDPDTGLALSFIRYFDGDTRTWRNRFDALYGFAPLYRELACRIAS